MLSVMVAVIFSGTVSGHVFLYDPPQRSSIWRHDGMDKTGLAIRNNDDMGLNCGGMWTQYDVSRGKCGVCGDPYDSSPNPHYLHQYPGKYAKGIISGCYQAGSRTMDAEVWVTAHHMGYFEFRLCENNNYKSPVNQSCLDKHLLEIETETGEPVGTKYYPDKSKTDGKYKMRLVLPTGLQCTQCVLQFLYNAGNSWGCSDDGPCDIGHGKQEQFWNCADIAVLPDCRGIVGNIAPADTQRKPAPPGPVRKQDDTASNASPINKANNPKDMHHGHVDLGALSRLLFQARKIGVENGAAEEDAVNSRSESEMDTETSFSTQGTSSHVHSHIHQQAHEDGPGQEETNDKRSGSGSGSSKLPQAGAHAHQAPDTATRFRGPARHVQRNILRSSAGDDTDARKTESIHGNRVDVPVGPRPSDVRDAETETDNGENCKGTGPWTGDPDMDHWCHVNCAQGYCPKSNCSCD